jgi:cyclase
LLFNKIIPYIDFEAGSNTKNWINILHKLSEMDISKVIPGHGDITDKKSLLAESEYLNDLRIEIQKYIEKKIPLEEIKKELKNEKYREWDGYTQRFSRNIESVYQEMTKNKN